MNTIVQFSRIGLLLLVAGLFIARSIGRSNNYAGVPGDAGTCANCHTGGTSATGSIDLSIAGNPTTYIAGQTYDLTLTLSDSDPGFNGNPRIGGFQIAAVAPGSNTSIGTFAPAGSNTYVQNTNRLVQTSPISMSGGTAIWSFQWTAPTTSPPASVEFYYTGNAADGNGSRDSGTGGNDHGSYAGSTAPLVLPVTFRSFLATPEGEQIALNWSTSAELNNDRFLIERSTDANIWAEIGKVLGSGTTDTEQAYRFVDTDRPDSETIYYRLKQVDFDGQYSYSRTVSVTASPVVDVPVVYPNPAVVGSTLTVRNTASGTLRLYDAAGRLQLSRPVREGTDRIDLDLAPGLYYLQVGNHTERLIVQGQ